MTRVSAVIQPRYHALPRCAIELAYNGSVPPGTEWVDVAERAQRLARNLAALPEPAMRRAALGEWAIEQSEDELVEVLAIILRLGRTGEAPYHLALAALIGILDGGAGGLDYNLQRNLYGRAKTRGHVDLAQLFLSAVTPERMEQPRLAALERDGRPLTLGERKQLARAANRELLARLLRDPDPTVIRLLLGNPRVTEADVLAIAARRPTTAEMQREIYASPRWIARYHVKRALVLNPFSPCDISTRLLALLSEHDIREVAVDGELPVPVRETAQRLLTGKVDPDPEGPTRS
jgi:hypothetical protein